MTAIASLSRAGLIDLLNDLGISSDLLTDALALAERVHGRQRRAGGGPYLDEHVYPITSGVARYLAESDPADVTVGVLIALLHDTIEDSADITVAGLVERYGPAVAGGVDILSKPSKRGERSSQEDSAEEARYVARIAVAPFAVRVIKIFDRINNLSAVHQRPPDKRRQYLDETRAHYLDLARDVDPALAKRMSELVDLQERTLTN